MTPDAEFRAEPTATGLLMAARGFSASFWGFAVTILLLAGVVSLRPAVVASFPAYVVGVAFLLLGAIWFLRGGNLSPRWTRASRQHALAVALQLYLVPFVGWWRTLDHPLYLAVNIALLAGATLWLLVSVHLLALEAARLLGDAILLVEARICLWIVPLLAGISLGLFAFGAIWAAGPGQLSASGAVRAFLLWSHPWSGLPAALPIILALAVTWEAKERCLQGVQRRADTSK